MVPARGRPLTPDVLVGDHGDRGVVDAVHAGLEQERRLDDGGARRRPGPGDLRAPCGDPLGDPRPQESLEPLAVRGRRERDLRDRAPVDRAVRGDVGAPARDDRVADLVGRVQVVDDGVGRERRRAELAQRLQRGRLAGAEAAGQPDERDGGGLGQLLVGGGALVARRHGVLGDDRLDGLDRAGGALGVIDRLGDARRVLDRVRDACRALARAAREDVLAEPELRHVVEVAGARAGVAARQHLALDALDRQRQATAVGVDLEDLHAHVVARLDDLARVLDVVVGELGDVDEALDAVEDLDERAKRDDLRDGALELVADVVGVDDPLPRVLLGLLETEGDPLAVAVDVEHLDLDRVADREDLGRVVDVRPGQLGDVDEAVDAVEVDERAEVDDVRDLALDDEPRLQAVEDLLALLLALLLEDRAAAQHDVVARAVELDDLRLDLRAHVLVEVRHAADVDERRGQEAAHAEVDDEPALDHLDDGALDGLPALRRRLDAPPCLLEARALLGHDETAVLVLLGEDQRVDLLAELDFVVRVDVLADRELVGGDDPFALVADVDEDLVVVDAHDAARDDVALLEGGERGVVVRDDLAVDLEEQAV